MDSQFDSVSNVMFYWIIQQNTFQLALIISTSVVHAGKEGDQEDVEVI